MYVIDKYDNEVMYRVTAKPAAPVVVDDVPDEYQDIYDEFDVVLDAAVDSVKTGLNSRGALQNQGLGMSLLSANANRAQDLLVPVALTPVRRFVDRFAENGIKVIGLDYQYPIGYAPYHAANPSVGTIGQYDDFYGAVGEIIEAAGMRYALEFQVLLGPPYSSAPGLTALYSSQTTDQHVDGRRESMVHALGVLSNALFATVCSELETEVSATGHAGLLHVPTYLAAVSEWAAACKAVAGSHLVGAGLGTWSPSYAQLTAGFVANPNVDAINLHIYPITGNNVAVAHYVGNQAKLANKRLVLGEIGFYKQGSGEGGGEPIATSQLYYSRDAWGFWRLQDQKFHKFCRGLLAQYNGIQRSGYSSIFWTHPAFTYLDHAATRHLTPSQLMQTFAQAAYQAAGRGEWSDTGAHYVSLG